MENLALDIDKWRAIMRSEHENIIMLHVKCTYFYVL